MTGWTNKRDKKAIRKKVRKEINNKRNIIKDGKNASHHIIGRKFLVAS
jgi:hypothetical protein